MGSKVFSAVTGIDRTQDEMWKSVGERTFNLERAIAVREGRRREHDTWTDYTFDKARGPYETTTGEIRTFSSVGCDRTVFGRLLDEYYALSGWDVETGIPRRPKLEELDLKDVADELEEKYRVPVPQ